MVDVIFLTVLSDFGFFALQIASHKKRGYARNRERGNYQYDARQIQCFTLNFD
ncbi:MAG: hypothetical protein H8E30_14275 [Alphaproteobacteria bacterium]|nr:hypothetical protein [Alphaproteobacteria bacterium]